MFSKYYDKSSPEAFSTTVRTSDKNELCRLFFRTDSPVLLSFPHFYMGDQKLREAVHGIDPPDADRHEFYIDVQPVS